jgi:hypothetical protein
LTEVQELVNNKSAFVLKKYILCPNTFFPIGFPASNGINTYSGNSPLLLRSNTQYYCGEDGSSKNNCTVYGGQFQVLSTLASFNNENKVNILIQGLTFQAAGNAGALLVAPGDVTFIDCIFKVHNECEVAAKLL